MTAGHTGDVLGYARAHDDPADRPERVGNAREKTYFAGVVELSRDSQSRGNCLIPINDFGEETLHDCISEAVESGTHVIKDG